MKTNLQLIEDYAAGDNGGLVTLFFHQGYYGSCFFKARQYLSDKHDAITVANDTYLVLLNKSLEKRSEKFISGGCTESGFRNYMLTISENKAIDLAKKGFRKPISLPENWDAKDEDPVSWEESHPSEIFFRWVEQVDLCAGRIKEREATIPNEALRKPPDSEFLELWRAIGDHDNEPLRSEFGINDEQIRVTKQRIQRRLRRCLGID